MIYAGAGNDYVWAGAGNDVVFGEDGNDYLGGNGGNDTILAGAGIDRLWGGAGNDYLFDSKVVPKRHIDRRIKVMYLCKKNFLRYRTFDVRNSGGRQRRAA